MRSCLRGTWGRLWAEPRPDAPLAAPIARYGALDGEEKGEARVLPSTRPALEVLKTRILEARNTIARTLREEYYDLKEENDQRNLMIGILYMGAAFVLSYELKSAKDDRHKTQSILSKSCRFDYESCDQPDPLCDPALVKWACDNFSDLSFLTYSTLTSFGAGLWYLFSPTNLFKIYNVYQLNPERERQVRDTLRAVYITPPEKEGHVDLDRLNDVLISALSEVETALERLGNVLVAASAAPSSLRPNP